MLLQRLTLPFTCISPDIDETPLPGEPADLLTLRLARLKAERVSQQHADAVVIGSDQVAGFDGKILGKPGSADAAVAQLMAFCDNEVVFHTAVTVGLLSEQQFLSEVVETTVRFRRFSEAEAQRYVAIDQPLDCAGGFKSEAAGPMLIQSIRSEDPTALIGLPLIMLCGMLREVGLTLP